METKSNTPEGVEGLAKLKAIQLEMTIEDQQDFNNRLVEALGILAEEGKMEGNVEEFMREVTEEGFDNIKIHF